MKKEEKLFFISDFVVVYSDSTEPTEHVHEIGSSGRAQGIVQAFEGKGQLLKPWRARSGQGLAPRS